MSENLALHQGNLGGIAVKEQKLFTEYFNTFHLVEPVRYRHPGHSKFFI